MSTSCITMVELSKKTGIDKTTLTMHMKKAGVKPVFEKRRFYLTEEDVKRILDYKNPQDVKMKERAEKAFQFMLDTDKLVCKSQISHLLSLTSTEAEELINYMTWRYPIYEETIARKPWYGINKELLPLYS